MEEHISKPVKFVIEFDRNSDEICLRESPDDMRVYDFYRIINLCIDIVRDRDIYRKEEADLFVSDVMHDLIEPREDQDEKEEIKK